MSVYYNEHDRFAAAWLRELIRDGLIAAGEVDERSIEDVTPDELRSFRQCHFFAGIGVWSLAARLAGIPDDAPLWSGSCPCQPFSAAGKGGGFDDERHLWPAFHYLIEQSSPAIVVGEQVAGADGDAWLDLVSADMDATGYAFGAAETVAAGFGAPHERSRNYWVAVTARKRHERAGLAWRWGDGLADNRAIGDVARPHDARPQGRGGSERGGVGKDGQAPALRPVDRMADNPSGGRREERQNAGRCAVGDSAQGRGAGFSDGGGSGGLADRFGVGRSQGRDYHGSDERHELDANDRARLSRIDRPGPVNGFWRDADWLRCRDEKWRPVEPDTFPLVDAGTFRNRVGLLRGAGNAITIGQATGFLQAVIASVGRWW